MIVTGYGTKGRGAVDSLLATGTPVTNIVVVDLASDAVEDARAQGLTAVLGDATRTAVLREAMATSAAAFIVTCNRDDTATLITLTARELNPTATIVSAVKDSENAHLLHESGARTVVISSESAGRLLGMATVQPRAVEVLEDLIVAGQGLEIAERPVAAAEVGGPVQAAPGELPLAVVRGDERIAFDDHRCRSLQPDDVVVSVLRA
jgi:voltage-gated potassium channel